MPSFRVDKKLKTALHGYVWLYNLQLLKPTLGIKTPLQAMKGWHKLRSELFKKTAVLPAEM